MTFLLASLVLGTATPCSATAMSRSDTARHQLLAPVQVVAHRNAAPLSAAPVQRIGGAELQRLSAMSLADALRHLAGVQLKDYGGVGGLKTIDVRAMGTQHTAVTMDGVAIGAAQNGIVDLGRFSTDQMEQIDLAHGAQSHSGQSATDYATAQVLHLHTRTPIWQKGERRHFEAKARWASFATHQAAARWEERVAPSLSLTAQLEGLSTEGRYPFTYRTFTPQGTLAHDTTARRDNSDVRWLRAQVALQGERLRTQAYLYASERGLPGAVVRGKFVHADRQWDAQVFLQAHRWWQWERQDFHLRGKFSHDYLRYRSDPSRDAGTMYVDHRYKQTQAYLSAAHTWRKHDWTFDAATDYTWAHVEGSAAQFPQPTRHSWHTALATKWEREGWQVAGSLLHLFLHEHSAVATSARHSSHWAPSLSVVLRRGAWTWRAYGKASLRPPTLNDLYYTIVGNAALKAERARQLNVGVSWQPSLWLLEADAYRHWVQDKIVAVPTSNQFRWTMQNLGQVDIAGFDLRASLSLPLPRKWGLHLRGSYTYQQALDVTSPSTPYYRHQIAYAPRHAASALARLTWRKVWCAYSFIYTGERYDQQTNIAANYAPPWYTSDLAVGQHFDFQRCRLQWQAEVSNLLDQRYEVVKGYPMPGRSLRCSVTLRW